VANEPVVILRPSGVKVVLVAGKASPIVVEPLHTTGVIIRRSDIPGPPGPPGPQGDPGMSTIGDFPDVVDGGNF
jgi:hypothetical protein